MAGKVITITSGKGGVGKTTATANIAVALASLGRKVACIDADIGLRNLDVIMGLENRIVYNIVDVVEGRARLRQAMIQDKRLKDELFLIPAAQTRDKTALSPSDMVRLCEDLVEMVDYVIIDSPAGIERGFRNAIAPADEVIIITNPEVSSIRDADRIVGLIEAEEKGPGRLIINRIKPEMVKRGDMLSPDDVLDILAIELLGLIPEDEGIVISSNRGMPATMSTTETMAGKAFRNVARRINGEDVPFMSMEDDSGPLQKFFKSLGIGGNKKEEQVVQKKTTTSAKPARMDDDKKGKEEKAEKTPPTPENNDKEVKAAVTSSPAAEKPSETNKEPAKAEKEAEEVKTPDSDSKTDK